MQDADKRFPSFVVLVPDEPLEKRITAVGQSDFLKQRVIDSRLLFALLDNSRQLFVVANQNEPCDGISWIMGSQQTNDVRFENLTCLVYDGKREVFDGEDERAGNHR